MEECEAKMAVPWAEASKKNIAAQAEIVNAPVGQEYLQNARLREALQPGHLGKVDLGAQPELVSVPVGGDLAATGDIGHAAQVAVRHAEGLTAEVEPAHGATAMDAQKANSFPINIRWGRAELELLEEGDELSLCRHLESGRKLYILTDYLRQPPSMEMIFRSRVKMGAAEGMRGS